MSKQNHDPPLKYNFTKQNANVMSWLLHKLIVYFPTAYQSASFA